MKKNIFQNLIISGSLARVQKAKLELASKQKRTKAAVRGEQQQHHHIAQHSSSCEKTIPARRRQQNLLNNHDIVVNNRNDNDNQTVKHPKKVYTYLLR